MKRRLEDSTLDLIFIRKERKFSISLTLSAQKSYLKFPAEEADNFVVSELADIRQCNKLNKMRHCWNKVWEYTLLPLVATMRTLSSYL